MTLIIAYQPSSTIDTSLLSHPFSLSFQSFFFENKRIMFRFSCLKSNLIIPLTIDLLLFSFLLEVFIQIIVSLQFSWLKSLDRKGHTHTNISVLFFILLFFLRMNFMIYSINFTLFLETVWNLNDLLAILPILKCISVQLFNLEHFCFHFFFAIVTINPNSQ